MTRGRGPVECKSRGTTWPPLYPDREYRAGGYPVFVGRSTRENGVIKFDRCLAALLEFVSTAGPCVAGEMAATLSSEEFLISPPTESVAPATAFPLRPGDRRVRSAPPAMAPVLSFCWCFREERRTASGVALEEWIECGICGSSRWKVLFYCLLVAAARSTLMVRISRIRVDYGFRMIKRTIDSNSPCTLMMHSCC